MSDVHLFLLVPNDSGSTWLQNSITQCANCVAFPTGLDGKGAAGKGVYPDQEINKLFSENKEMWSDPTKYDWPAIKQAWSKCWSESTHFCTASPKVFLEKTPQAIYASDMYVDNFDNVRFIVSIRNPYAVAEGIRRTVGNVSIERCAKHWTECAKRQHYNLQAYQDISLSFPYEALVRNTPGIESRIKNFLPMLDDLDFGQPAVSHSMDGGLASRKLIDYNRRQIQNLSRSDMDTITRVVFEYPEVPRAFGYEPLQWETFRD